MARAQDRARADYWSRRAKAAGYRSRAVWKLEAIHRREKLFRPGMKVVDLGAAPGSWSQLAAQLVGPTGRVVAVDLQAVEPISGVQILCGDCRDPAIRAAISEALEGGSADLVICDLAPNITGVNATDQANALELAQTAADFACNCLVAGGLLLMKGFQGESFGPLREGLRQFFAPLKVLKPAASRSISREVYLLGRRRPTERIQNSSP